MNRNTYWRKSGTHQKIHNRLEALIPSEGRADFTHIELLRCASNIYYDFYNNGAGNLHVYKDQLFLIKSWEDEIKAKMQQGVDFDKIIGECMEDAEDENRRYISAMLDNEVSSVYDGLEKVMDAIILVVEEKQQEISRTTN